MRFTIARICVNTDGTYSCDAPLNDSDGVYRMGTISIAGSTTLQDMLELLHTRLTQPDIQEQIRKRLTIYP